LGDVAAVEAVAAGAMPDVCNGAPVVDEHPASEVAASMIIALCIEVPRVHLRRRSRRGVWRSGSLIIICRALG
jgi:hypothetical protein